MFESLMSKIVTTVHNVVRAVGAALKQSPWIAPAAILIMLFLV